MKNEKALMIVSGSFDEQFVSLIQNIHQLYAIYLLCAHPTAYEQWTPKYYKLKGVFSEMKLLCTRNYSKESFSKWNMTT